MDLYHADIRLPDLYRSPAHRVNLQYSRHALKACQDDRYAKSIPVFDSIPLQCFETVELGVNPATGRIEKYVMRGHWTTDLDLIFVLIPSLTSAWFVKTVWINERNDSHKTLDRSKYVC